MQPNQLVLTVQPDEGVSLSLGAKIPGPRMRIRPVNMEFRYGTSFLSESPEAYERLILDAMRGDATPVHARGRGGGLVGDLRPDPEGVVGDAGAAADLCRPGRPGPVEADALLEGSTSWRPI